MNQNWEIFTSFLKQNGVFNQYNKAVTIQYLSLDNRINYLQNLHISLYIRHAFGWHETKEGFGFWLKVDRKWAEITQNLEELFDHSFEIYHF
jgi:hypothetical protein